jgi:hypothetical protein
MPAKFKQNNLFNSFHFNYFLLAEAETYGYKKGVAIKATPVLSNHNIFIAPKCVL